MSCLYFSPNREVMRCCFQEIREKNTITLLNTKSYSLSFPSMILYLKRMLHWGSTDSEKTKKLIKELRAIAVSEILYSVSCLRHS